MVLQTQIFFLVNHFSPTRKKVDLWYKTTFFSGQPLFPSQISRTTFLEPLFNTFLEKWLQIKWSSVFWILNLRFKYWMASMPQFVSWILPANSNDNTFCEVAGGMCINFQGAKNSIYASWNWSKKWHSIRTWNPSIYNIIRWVAWTMGKTNRRPSVWCSK